MYLFHFLISDKVDITQVINKAAYADPLFRKGNASKMTHCLSVTV